MRDIPTIQGLRNRAVPSTREQIVSELARMEHEKARLERELNIWQSNAKRTEGRILQVQDRLALLRNVLDESLSMHRSGDEEEENTNGKYQEVSLEY
jgi:chromosome segregation ATPase